MIRFTTAAAALALAGLPLIAAAQGADVETIDFGDDTSMWANDGECDDPRFEGSGMAVPAVDADRFKDAADCREQYELGNITLGSQSEAERPALRVDGIQFGSDTSEWSMDGECDDPRFAGEGMAFGTLLPEDAYADRSDCLEAWEAGGLTYDSEWRFSNTPPPTAAEIDAIDFGDDTSDWTFDYECDDPRFEGPGMALDPVETDVKADASDCRSLFMMGQVTYGKPN
ncbi:MAG: hypothetical protein AAF216_04540 [Pseudomonadota bacterium]